MRRQSVPAFCTSCALAGAAAVTAAAFSRAGAASVNVREAAADAGRFASQAFRLRDYAVRNKGQPLPDALRQLEILADKYGARVQAPCDKHGMHVGLVFTPRVHMSGFHSVLFVC